jgi:hypothetical protein
MEGRIISWSCKRCLHGGPTRKIRYTDIPRKGDYEEVCVYCGDTSIIYFNPESCKEWRLKKSQMKNTITEIQCCTRCCCARYMNVEARNEKWKIGECIECGQRHDIT